MISEKQRKILAFPYSDYDALICDGAVRSGKTSIMTVAFVDWAMRRFSGQRFGVCGRTVDSCTKNIILPYLAMRYAQERYSITWRRADKTLEVRRGAVCNVFEVFGGKDESSFALIQGRTLAGVLLDEVVLMPRSFVEQALTRCSVDGAKLWFSCNPGSPQHWFYTDWIRRRRERNALYLHFEMTDNPGLSKKTIERYQTMFSGVFYDRYVRGLWVLPGSARFHWLPRVLLTTIGRHKLKRPKSANPQDFLRIEGRRCRLELPRVLSTTVGHHKLKRPKSANRRNSAPIARRRPRSSRSSAGTGASPCARRETTCFQAS